MRIFLSLLTIILTACSPFEFTVSPASDEILTVNLSHELLWIQNLMHPCLATYPETALFIQSENKLFLEKNEIYISLGMSPNNGDLHAALLGQEEIYVIANTAIDNNSINLMSIRNSYLSLDPQFQAWTYASGNQSREIFNVVLLESISLSPHVKIVPDPLAMLDAISNSPNAIGYIPKSWISKAVQVIPLDNELKNPLRQPIIALTNGEPKRNSVLFLSCLHHELQQ
ncbi:MAG: hypothetical protein IMY76_08770 [Chloroflexi bacterium]|nr:hypothetical protein [Chloroflexota bacterium]